MKKQIFSKNLMFGAVTLAASCLLMSGCGTKKAESPVETSAAAQTEADAETTEAETEAEEETDAGIEALQMKLSKFERRYPGLGEDAMFISSCEMLAVENEGYEALNKALATLGEDSKSNMNSAFKDGCSIFTDFELDEWQMNMTPFSAEQFICVDRADSALLSFTVTHYDWTGGAHPNSALSTYNYDPQTGKKLELKDIVKDYEAFYEDVSAKLCDYEYADGFFDEWTDTLDEIFHGEGQPDFYVTEDMLVVSFDTYCLGPYALGPVCVEYPFSESRDMFYEQYIPEEIPKGLPVDGMTAGLVSVYDSISERGEYTDDVDNTFWYTYKLPYFLYGKEGTKYTDEVNAEVEELKKQYVDPQLECMQDGSSLWVIDAGYTTAVKDGITSVKVQIDTDYEEVIYRCYNLDADGNKAANADILKLYGLTDKQFVTRARELVADHIGCDPSVVPDEASDEFGALNARSLEEISADNPLYIDPVDQSLCFIAGIHTPAGAGYYELSFSLPETAARKDGLQVVVINPQSKENIRKEGGVWYLRDAADTAEYCFDQDTILVYSLPEFEYGDTPETWMTRYLDDETLSGFGMGDIIYMLVDDSNHIAQLEAIYWWD